MKKETLRHRNVSFELVQDADGSWGWIIGNATLVGTFAYRDSALRSAQRHIDDIKSK